MADLPYRVLALDLDGTLTNSQKQVTPYTRDVVIRAGEAGMTVVLASGRPTPGVTWLADQLELERLGGYIVSSNGAELYSCRDHETVYSAAVPVSYLPRIKQTVERFGLAMVCYDDKHVISESPDDPVVLYEARNDHMPLRCVSDLLQTVTWASPKIMIVGNEAARIEACLAYAQETFGKELSVFLSDRCFLEFAAPGVGKESGIRRLMEHLGLGREALMAFGDGLNDIGMLKYAGLSVAMANAYPEVRAAAQYVTASNDEDGVAKAIHKFILDA